jgi:hypothetical protein
MKVYLLPSRVDFFIAELSENMRIFSPPPPFSEIRMSN